ncbi:protein translocase subunit secE/sec61 gamma [Picrophilus oshimae DSM 9789]|nr:protein translocase subunit secE/sec61 gamma [Picrophilus oshimae DSM 9789]
MEKNQNNIQDKLIAQQEKIERKFQGIGKGKYSRIMKMAKKPNGDEYTKVLLIAGFGIVFLGFIGFVIYLLMSVYF